LTWGAVGAGGDELRNSSSLLIVSMSLMRCASFLRLAVDGGKLGVWPVCVAFGL